MAWCTNLSTASKPSELFAMRRSWSLITQQMVWRVEMREKISMAWPGSWPHKIKELLSLLLVQIHLKLGDTLVGRQLVVLIVIEDVEHMAGPSTWPLQPTGIYN